jgi:hypothetical protein
LQGRIDLFFFLLGGLMVANLGVFVAVAVRYQYKQVGGMKEQKVRTHKFVGINFDAVSRQSSTRHNQTEL